MAIELIERYPDRVQLASSDYPHGAGKNKTDATSDDGTPFEQDYFNDQEAFFQSLMDAAGIDYSNTVDTVPTSQLVQALKIVTGGFTEVDVAGDTAVTIGTNDSRVAGIRLTGELTADIDVIVPDTQRIYHISNDTTGNYTITFRTSTGGGVTLSKKGGGWIRSNGNNVIYMYANEMIWPDTEKNQDYQLAVVDGILMIKEV